MSKFGIRTGDLSDGLVELLILIGELVHLQRVRDISREEEEAVLVETPSRVTTQTEPLPGDGTVVSPEARDPSQTVAQPKTPTRKKTPVKAKKRASFKYRRNETKYYTRPFRSLCTKARRPSSGAIAKSHTCTNPFTQ